MAVGPDEMVNLEFLQDRADERAAPRPGGSDFVERGEGAKNTHERSARASQDCSGALGASIFLI